MCKKKFNLTNTGRGRLIWRCENDCTLSLPIQLSVGRRPPTARRRRRRRRRPPKPGSLSSVVGLESWTLSSLPPSSASR